MQNTEPKTIKKHESHSHTHQQTETKNCCGDCKNGKVGACGKINVVVETVKKIDASVKK